MSNRITLLNKKDLDKKQKKIDWDGQGKYYIMFFSDYIHKTYNNVFIPTGYFLFFNTVDLIATDGDKTCNGNCSVKNDLYFNYFYNSINNSDKDLIYIPITIQVNIFMGHQNMLLIDKRTKEVELYDPYGGKIDKYIPSFSYDTYIDNVRSFMKRIVPDYTFYKPSSFFSDDLDNIQDLEVEYCNRDKFIVNTPIGFCVVYSLWYLEVRAKNSHIDRQLIINEIKKSFRDDVKQIKNNRGTVIITNVSLCTSVRNYTTFLTSLKDEAGIKKRFVITYKIYKKLYFIRAALIGVILLYFRMIKLLTTNK